MNIHDISVPAIYVEKTAWKIGSWVACHPCLVSVGGTVSQKRTNVYRSDRRKLNAWKDCRDVQIIRDNFLKHTLECPYQIYIYTSSIVKNVILCDSLSMDYSPQSEEICNVLVLFWWWLMNLAETSQSFHECWKNISSLLSLSLFYIYIYEYMRIYICIYKYKCIYIYICVCVLEHIYKWRLVEGIKCIPRKLSYKYFLTYIVLLSSYWPLS